MSKDFSKNIVPKKAKATKKPTDEQIEKALEEKGKGTKSTLKGKSKREQTTFNLRMPETMYEELRDTAIRTGVSMSSIIKQGITAELKRLNQ